MGPVVANHHEPIRTIANVLRRASAELGHQPRGARARTQRTPAKHIAAVYYILAERFDEDPFLIFAWRGRTQDELLERLRAVRARSLRGAAAPIEIDERVDGGAAARPLTELIHAFWGSGPELAELRVSPLAGTAPDALLRRLGSSPVQTASGRDVAELLAPVYSRLAELAERRALQ